MIVVVEGIDGAGKTRLARTISAHISLQFADRKLLGQGPPESPEQMDERIRKYLQEDDVIFDRHPIISQPIYGTMRDDPPINPDYIAAFYAKNPVIIYARCVQDRLKNHEINPDTDSQKHMKMLVENYDQLLQMYDEWAMKHALIWYTDYSQGAYVMRAVQGIMKR